MATARQIRARIRVAKNIEKITYAMKMVAAARLRRAQEAVGASRPYSEKMREVLQSLSANIGGSISHPLLRKPAGEPQSIGIFLISGDRGLSGAYNSNVIRRTNQIIKGLDPDRVQMVCIGKRGATFFRRRGYKIAAEHPVPATGLSFTEAQQLSRTARDLFESGQIDALYLVYTKFVSAMTQHVQDLQILPIEPIKAVEGERGPRADYIFEPNPEQILSSLLPRYVDTQIYQAILESVASQHGSQMTAMSSATDNAGKMISRFTLSLNRARQAAITKEIAEIVGGAEALK
jgi:F-type H+-transporting ATPase subunit gamma